MGTPLSSSSPAAPPQCPLHQEFQLPLISFSITVHSLRGILIPPPDVQFFVFLEYLCDCLRGIYHLFSYTSFSFCNSCSYLLILPASTFPLSQESFMPTNQAWGASLFSSMIWLITGMKTWGLGLLPWETCSLLLVATATKWCLMCPG